MRKSALVLAISAMVLSTAAPPALTATYAYGSYAEMPTQELAQETLDSPIYGTCDPPPGDPLNLGPDGDGVACNDEVTLVGQPPLNPSVDYGPPQGV